MKGITQCITRCAVVAAVLLLAPNESPAYDGNETGITDSSSYAEYTSQLDTWVNRSLHHSLEMLGITEMEYTGTFIHRENEQLYLFQTEPEIKEVVRGGPAHDILKNGDVIVAIDGVLITTKKAGRRFANLTAGESVELEVRRWWRKHTVTIIPRAVPEPEMPIEFTAHYSEQSNSLTIKPGRVIQPELAYAIKKIKDRQAELTAMTDSLGVPAAPEYYERAPRGWIGFGLSFSGSIRRNDHGKPADWLFFELPSIKSIQPDGPADEAGLCVGDVLLEIDGKKLNSEGGGSQFSRMEPGQTVKWKVQRGDKTFMVETVAAQPPQREQSKAVLEPFDIDTLRPLRYTGTLGDTEIEVRGDQNVQVQVDEKTNEIVIQSGDSVVRLKLKAER